MSKKKISFWELVFMNVSAIYAIRWLSKSTSSDFGLGLGAISAWIVASFIFFVPLSLMCAELAATYPEKDGGLYCWVKEAYGEKYGFMVSWLTWITIVFLHTISLTFFSVNIPFIIGIPQLAQNKFFVLICSLTIFWLMSFISTKGMTFGKFFTNVGVFGSMIPTLLLIFLAVFGVIFGKYVPASDYSFGNFIPKMNFASLVAISSVMLALTGAESTAVFISDIDKPEKNFPKATISSAAIIALLYVLGSFAMTIVINPSDISASRGLFESIEKISGAWGFGNIFSRFVALGIAVASFGSTILYISSSVKMLFGSVKKGVFPEKLTQLNENGIPARAVYFQAIFVSAIIILTEFLPGVEAIYNVFVTMTSLVALFPYVLMIVSYIKLRKTLPDLKRPYSVSKNNSTCIALAYFTLIITLIGLVLSLVPTMDTIKENVICEIELIGGSIFFINLGLWLWNRNEKKLKNGEQSEQI